MPQSLLINEFEPKDDQSSTNLNRWLHWLTKLFVWDGCLPLAVYLVCLVMRQLPFDPKIGGGNFTLLEAASLFVPLVAFLVRWALGVRHIRQSGYAWQWVFFVLGLMILAIGETFILLIPVLAPNELKEVQALFGVIWLIYLGLMAIAFFPLQHARSS